MVHEVAESGTQHIQEYVAFVNRKYMATVKKTFDIDEMHLEQKRRTCEEAANYCKKDGQASANYL